MIHLHRWLAFVVHGQRLPPPNRAARRGPPRNPRYRAWVRSKPCLVCGTHREVEACHTGPHGLSQKSSDFQCIPLCSHHHRTGNDALDRIGPKRFQEVHGLDTAEIVKTLQAEWLRT